MSKSSKKNYALVTGASAGLGADFAKLLAADGRHLILVARRKDRLDALAQELGRAHGVEVNVVAQDLTAADAVERLMSGIEDEGIEVSTLINNAGFGSNGAFADLPRDHELNMVRLNVLTLVDLSHRLAVAMRARGRGEILNLGSTAGFQPGPYMATYYATKAFVNSFSEALAYELRDTGVTVTLSCPGPTATEFAGLAGSDSAGHFTKGKPAPSMVVAKEAYAAMKSGRTRIIHGLKNRIGVQAGRLSPRAAVVAVAASLNRP